MTDKPIIAVINSSEDVTDAISLFLSEEGLPSVQGHVADFKKGREDITEFLEKNKPEVVIFDIAPPYEENWNFFKLVESSEEAKGITFILTTTNREQLAKIAGETNAIEIVGKPFDLEQVVRLVKTAIKK